jgi:hypothetical protein
MPHARRAILCTVCLCGALAVPPPAIAAADAAAEFRDQIRQQREQFEISVRAQPLLDQKRIDELFRLRLEGDDLVLTTRLPPTPSYSSMRAELEGFPFPVVVARMRLGRGGASQFEFILDDYADPDVFARLHVLSKPGMLRLDKTEQHFDGTRRVRLIQGERQVHLSVFERDRSRNVTLLAEDFASLRRQYPREVDEFIRPLLRAIRQEAAFAPDPATAWQVLSDRWPLDPSVAGRVAAELAPLDADDFRTREAAVARLEAIGRDAALAVRRLDHAGLSAEQSARLDGVAARFEPVSKAKAAELRHDVTFLLDCLYGDEPLARRLALARLAELVGRPLELDVDAPVDVRIADVDRLRGELLSEAAARQANPEPDRSPIR